MEKKKRKMTLKYWIMKVKAPPMEQPSIPLCPRPLSNPRLHVLKARLCKLSLKKKSHFPLKMEARLVVEPQKQFARTQCQEIANHPHCCGNSNPKPIPLDQPRLSALPTSLQQHAQNWRKFLLLLNALWRLSSLENRESRSRLLMTFSFCLMGLALPKV